MSTFYILDLDRTLANTEKLYTVLDTVLERDTNIKPSQLYEERATAEAEGHSFSVVGRLRQLLSEDSNEVDWPQVQQAFIAEARRADMFEPHAAELLHILDERELPYGIITYGNETWQIAKIEASGLKEVPHLVTRIKEKGQLLAGWKHSENLFVIPPAMTRNFKPLIVDSLVFLDDKAVSFKNIPTGVRGVFVRSPIRKLLPSQQGVLPPGVEIVSGLGGAIELLFD